MANAATRFLDKVLYGPVTPYKGSDIVTYEPAPQPLRTSWVFDSHVVTEASAGGRGGGRGSTPKSTSLAYAENDQWGQDNIMRSFMGLTPRERKETLLSIFLANPWASNCIDTIALYIISGGMTIEPRVPNPDKSQRKKIEQLLLRINEDWDFNQYVYDHLTDEMIFGESFAEYTMRGGVPHQLFSIDCVTMDTEHDKWGRVVRYKQQLNLTTEVNYLDKETIIRWWNPHKRAKVDPFSPMERVQDAILLDKKMVNWMTTFFQKGAKFPYWVEFLGDQDEAERYLTWFKQNYTGEKNAHLPPVAYNGAKFHEFGSGALDIDFNSGLDRMQTIVLSAFHVPPSIACIAESGNRLTDMSDGQRKILQYIACDPRRHRFFEKFNYRLIFPYFGDDYYVSTRYADFRDDKSLAEVADMRIRNGSIKINEARQEMGKEPYTDGGDIPVIVTTKEVTPVPRLDNLESEQAQIAQQGLDAADLNNQLLKTKVDQAKNPPPPVMIPGQQQGAVQQGKQPPAQKAQGKQQKKQEAQEHNTGMMLAFMLDEKTATQLAIPGGEPVQNLHITLAYLGDIEDDRASDKRYPDRDPLDITRVITSLTLDTVPLSGYVGGVGRFFPAETDETPVIALVDVPGLSEFRAQLVRALQSCNYFIADNHGYTPHITLDYIDKDAPMPIKSVPSLPLTFDAVWLCVGDERTAFKFLNDGMQPVKESAVNPFTRDNLTQSLHILFTEVQERAASQMHEGIDPGRAYNWSADERYQLISLLGNGYSRARKQAYHRAMATAHIVHAHPLTAVDIPVISWAADQAHSIISTYREQVAKFVNESHAEGNLDEGLVQKVKEIVHKVKSKLTDFLTWKIPQIVNVAWMTGTNEGTDQAVQDILDEATTPDGSDIPVQNLRVRVLPMESSNDLCAEWAGRDFDLAEYDDIPDFPIHPGCPHYKEIYDAGGEGGDA